MSHVLQKNKLTQAPITESQLSYLWSDSIETWNLVSIGKALVISYTKNKSTVAPVSNPKLFIHGP